MRAHGGAGSRATCGFLFFSWAALARYVWYEVVFAVEWGGRVVVRRTRYRTGWDEIWADTMAKDVGGQRLTGNMGRFLDQK